MAKKFPDKFDPIREKEYVVTDQCFWEPLTEKERLAYNPYDEKRSPHSIQLVDTDTGTVVNLKSGSIVKIIEAK